MPYAFFTITPKTDVLRKMTRKEYYAVMSWCRSIRRELLKELQGELKMDMPNEIYVGRVRDNRLSAFETHERSGEAKYFHSSVVAALENENERLKKEIGALKQQLLEDRCDFILGGIGSLDEVLKENEKLKSVNDDLYQKLLHTESNLEHSRNFAKDLSRQLSDMKKDIAETKIKLARQKKTTIALKAIADAEATLDTLYCLRDIATGNAKSWADIEKVAVSTHTIREAITARQEPVNGDLLEALKEARSALLSLNYKGTTPFFRAGGTFYGQTDEWCEWVENEILPVVSKAISRAEAQKVQKVKILYRCGPPDFPDQYEVWSDGKIVNTEDNGTPAFTAEYKRGFDSGLMFAACAFATGGIEEIFSKANTDEEKKGGV